jgi:outer membrane protein TolC
MSESDESRAQDSLDRAKADLLQAEGDLKRWQDALERSSGVSPEKYQSNIEAAMRARESAIRRISLLSR